MSKLTTFLIAIAFFTPPLSASEWLVLKSEYKSSEEVSSEKFISLSKSGVSGATRGSVWFKKIYKRDDLPKISNLAVYLGRIFDADEAYWNGNYIGSTGVDVSGGRFMPHITRVYPIRDIHDINTLLIRVHKVAGSHGGIGPNEIEPLFDSYEKLKWKSQKRDLIRTQFPLWFGIVLIFFGVYYAYLSFFIRSKKYYINYGLTFFCFGVYGVCFSFWPYEVIESSHFVMRVHAVAAFWGVVFLLRWVIDESKSVWKYFHFVNKSIALVLTFFGLVLPGYEGPLQLFLGWHSVLLINLIVMIIYSGRKWYRSSFKSNTGFVFALGIFSLVIIYDILVTRKLIDGEQWSVVSFLCILIATVWALARDFAFAYSDVEQKVEDRTVDLQDALDEIKTLEKAKQNFFTNISHDLKTPIAVAMTNLEQGMNIAHSAGKEFMQNAHSSMARLRDMVVNLLDTVKGESGVLALSWSEGRPYLCVNAWLKNYEPLLKSKRIELIKEFDLKQNTQIPWDEQRMERVFDNLFSNAIKFATGRNRIYVRIYEQEHYLYIEIEDSGPGVNRNERKKIFERYYQGTSTHLKDHGGSGIGLSFVQVTIKQMNGDVYVTDGDKEHSKFVVKLLKKQNVDFRQRGPSESLSNKGIKVADYPPMIPKHISPSKPNLLVAEDNPDVAQSLIRILEDDYNVYFAESGKDGLSVLNVTKIQCIVSDIMMPGMDGVTFLAEVRKNAKWNMVPFLFLTSKSDDQDVIDALSKGAQDYIVKPFKIDVLKARIQTQLQVYYYAEQSIASEKMAALGLLAAGLAHEIKNPMMPILNSSNYITKFAQNIEAHLQKDEYDQAIKLLEGRMANIISCSDTIVKHIKRINEIVKSIQGYSSISTDRIEININEMIQDALVLLEHKRKKKGVAIEVFGNIEIKVLGYISLSQVFINIVDNAIYAVKPHTGKIKISMGSIEGGLSVTIADNGPGIPEKHLSTIFDPFHTSKPVGEGTGLGLYISKDIVENLHGGSLEVKSDKDGTSFYVRIPSQAPEHKGLKQVKFHGEDLHVI